MDSHILNLVKKTIPPQLFHLAESIFESSVEYVEERHKASERNAKRFNFDNSHSTPGSSNVFDKEVEIKASALAIARVIMQLWSSKMFRYAENLILTKAVQEKYIKESHRKFVLVFEDDIKEEEDSEWVIQDQDEIIIDLLWNIFNLKKHFEGVHIHRSLIQKSYDRLKKFLPELHPEIIERHDLTKFAFSQAIGYTLKFVHKTWHHIWRAATDLHLRYEPHHPQAWSKKHTPDEKLQKLKRWTQMSCDSEGVCPYGLNMATLDLASEHLPLPFLLESYVDMVAIEWERNKKQNPNITDGELIYMDEKFLMRYVNVQRNRICDLVNQVISSDQSWKNLSLSVREAKLLFTVSEKEKGPIMFRIGNHKKRELERQKKKAIESGDVVPIINATDEMMKKASDYAFYFNTSHVIMEVWNSEFRKFIEQLVLQRAIKEGYIKEEHLKWICFADKTEGTAAKALVKSSFNPADYEGVVDLIWEEFNVREHFSQMKDHRYWLRRSYQRLSKFVPELPDEVIERHDLSKFAFSQAIGYTLKWVHKIDTLVWKKACDHHLNNEPHHPQMWQQRHTPQYKEKCLESFLCVQAGGDKYGVEISQLNLTTENMALVFLLESFVDMVAVEWERNKNKSEDLSDAELVYMDEKFLNRYSYYDKTFVKKFMEKFCFADKLGSK